MTIALTGATGSLGRLVVDSLLASGDTPIAIVRDAAKASDIAAKGVEVRVADYSDPVALRSAFEGVDTLLLISGNQVGQRIQQHQNAIDAAESAGVGRVVYTSAPKATESTLVLAPEHKATEEYLTASGLNYTILRNNWYNENYFQQVDAVRETGVLVAAAGDGKVASASRKDFAEAAARVLVTDDHDRQVYELTGDTAWDYDEFASVLSDVTGREVVYKPVEAPALVQTLVEAGLEEGTAQFVAALDNNIAEGTIADTDPALSRLIGRPTTTLLETLQG